MIKKAFGSYIRGPVNMGSGKGTTIFDLARRMVDVSRLVSKIDVAEERVREVGRFVADITRAKRLLKIPEPDHPLRLCRGLFRTHRGGREGLAVNASGRGR
jgi:UDP-glucose 4-epimerase